MIDENELEALKDMYYLRMIKAESALERFCTDSLKVESAQRILQEAKEATKNHIKQFPD